MPKIVQYDNSLGCQLLFWKFTSSNSIFHVDSKTVQHIPVSRQKLKQVRGEGCIAKAAKQAFIQGYLRKKWGKMVSVDPCQVQVHVCCFMSFLIFAALRTFVFEWHFALGCSSLTLDLVQILDLQIEFLAMMQVQQRPKSVIPLL